MRRSLLHWDLWKAEKRGVFHDAGLRRKNTDLVSQIGLCYGDAVLMVLMDSMVDDYAGGFAKSSSYDGVAFCKNTSFVRCF